MVLKGLWSLIGFERRRSMNKENAAMLKKRKDILNRAVFIKCRILTLF